MRGYSEQVAAGGCAGRGVGLAGRRRRRLVHHRNRHLRRESRRRSGRSPWTPTPRAPRSTRVPWRTRCWPSAAATPWATSWCGSRRGFPAGKTWPAPKTPVDARSERLHVQAARDGDHGRPALQDPQLRRRRSTTSTRCPRSTRPFNKGMPPTLKEATTMFDKPEAVFHIKCDVHPWMSAYIARLHPSLLLGDEHRREVHDRGPRPGHLRDHRLAREARHADGVGHGRRQRQEDARTSSSPFPRSSTNRRDQPHESSQELSPHPRRTPRTKPITRRSASGASTSSPSTTRSSASSTPSPACCSCSSASR